MNEAIVKSVRVFTVVTGVVLLLVNVGVRLLPFKYDTPSRELVAASIAFSGLALLAWSPLGLIILVRRWRLLAIIYRVVFVIDLGFAAALLYYVFRP